MGDDFLGEYNGIGRARFCPRPFSPCLRPARCIRRAGGGEPGLFFSAKSVMLPEEGAERPKAVTIIGRVWLVVAVLSLCRVLVNLAVWTVLQPDAPSLFGGLVA